MEREVKEVKAVAAQGDVLVNRVDKIPEGFVAVSDNVVGHSETGHHHVAMGGTLYRNPSEPFLAYLALKEPVDIVHQRSFDTHTALRLLKDDSVGETIFEIHNQVEYTPEGWRRAQD